MGDTDVTELLRELSQGSRGALDLLIPLVYDELRHQARRQLRNERAGHTFDSSALVNETYLRLLNVERVRWQNRVHFLAVAARIMRRVLIDYARARNRDKRGGPAARVSLSEAAQVSIATDQELLALNEALSRLETLNERHCRVVECRYFAGMSVEETAAALEISPATVKRDWAFCRAWLNRELSHRSGDAAGR